VAVLLAAAAPSDGSSRKPFIALVHSAQATAPHTLTADNLTAFFLLDKRAHTLSFTVSEGDEQLFFRIAGPAAPGSVGEVVVPSTAWQAGEITVGPLSKSALRALRRGRLYIEFFEPSALPEPPRAMRGQILPIPGVSY
jgi:hypothetical protein